MKEITSNENRYIEFLNFASRVHKYSFDEQLLLYAQKQDVHMVATFDIWKKLGRFVKRGSTAALLFDYTTQQRKYVFDISETGGEPLQVFDWQLLDNDKNDLLRYWNTYEKQSGTLVNWEDGIHAKIASYQKPIGDQIHPFFVKDIEVVAAYIIYQRTNTLIPEDLLLDVQSVLQIGKRDNTLLEIQHFANLTAKEFLQDVERILNNELKKRGCFTMTESNLKMSYREENGNLLPEIETSEEMMPIGKIGKLIQLKWEKEKSLQVMKWKLNGNYLQEVKRMEIQVQDKINQYYEKLVTKESLPTEMEPLARAKRLKSLRMQAEEIILNQL
ncbi:ArdC-like ssDNA-binding domain-containing protein (plasmid) [Listeria monocytogenes]|nr:ArdC-like ssDNA-binding domain-containing protein [Listeria monocytogenes]WOS36411.1 ArdC-like ssDNA-binding domain-containing protein [Listeria monocytogenes]